MTHCKRCEKPLNKTFKKLEKLFLKPLALCFVVCVVSMILSACSVTGSSRVVAGSVIKVRSGDTVSAIARRYKVPQKSIIRLNRLRRPYHLRAGQRLRIPAKQYQVRQGDRLSTVAKRHGVKLSALMRVNKIRDADRVRAGKTLSVPAQRNRSQRRNHQQAKPLRIVKRTTGQQKVVPRRTESTQHKARPKNTNAIKRRVTTAQANNASKINQTKRAQRPSSRKRAVVARRTPPKKSVDRSLAAPSKIASPAFVWPVRGVVISGFGPKSNGLKNDGINIRVPQGTPIRAAAPGEVVYVGTGLEGFGHLILIRHNQHWMTAYAHSATCSVQKGTKVAKGTQIATVGRRGNVHSPQLHFELRYRKKPVNPQNYLH